MWALERLGERKWRGKRRGGDFYIVPLDKERDQLLLGVNQSFRVYKNDRERSGGGKPLSWEVGEVRQIVFQHG